MTGYVVPNFDTSRFGAAPTVYGNGFTLPNYGYDFQTAQPAATANVEAPVAAAPITAPAGINYPAAPVMNKGLADVLGGTQPENKSGLGMNLGTMQLALGGLNTIGSLWSAWQSNKLARDQFNFSKQFAETNLANSIKSYNTTLQNQSEARGAYEGWSGKKTDDYIRENRLGKP